jgi:hypothetical protein
VALGYKQLIEVEDAFRTLKHTLNLRSVYHRVEERIRVHVPLCWLALLLGWIIERRTEMQWPQIRQTLQRMRLGEFAGPEGAVWQRTKATLSRVERKRSETPSLSQAVVEAKGLLTTPSAATSQGNNPGSPRCRSG